VRRVWDFVAYILIALAVAAGLIWSASYNVSEDSLVKWGGLTINTLAIFWWVIKQSRRLWRNRVFWWTMTGILVIHLATFSVVLINVEHWRMAWFFVICTLEVIPITAYGRVGLDDGPIRKSARITRYRLIAPEVVSRDGAAFQAARPFLTGAVRPVRNRWARFRSLPTS
jgi:hypothetical protein